MSASITVSALKAVIKAAVTTRETPSPFVSAIAPNISSKGFSTHITVPGRYQIPQNTAQKRAHIYPLLTLLLLSCSFKAFRSRLTPPFI